MRMSSTTLVTCSAMRVRWSNSRTACISAWISCRWVMADSMRAVVLDHDWKLLAQGPILLVIHGTFSQAHTGFAGLSSAFVTQLNQRYQNRVIAFDHFTLSQDPTDSVKWFLAQMPPGLTLETDIVCDSRAVWSLESSRRKRRRLRQMATPSTSGTSFSSPPQTRARS